MIVIARPDMTALESPSRNLGTVTVEVELVHDLDDEAIALEAEAVLADHFRSRGCEILGGGCSYEPL
jgi:hypothetical protein